jgi:glycosyltransferase involved in cell wall biosynthesis
MKKLKILILSDYAFAKGGAEKVAITSSTGLAGKGHEVVFFSAVGPVDDELLKTDLKELICLNQKDILDNPNRLNAVLSGIYNWKAIRRLKRLFSRWIPDIAHIHGVSKALSWAPINLINYYKIPIVYTLHDYGLICPNLG